MTPFSYRLVYRAVLFPVVMLASVLVEPLSALDFASSAAASAEADRVGFGDIIDLHTSNTGADIHASATADGGNENYIGFAKTDTTAFASSSSTSGVGAVVFNMSGNAHDISPGGNPGSLAPFSAGRANGSASMSVTNTTTTATNLNIVWGILVSNPAFGFVTINNDIYSGSGSITLPLNSGQSTSFGAHVSAGKATDQFQVTSSYSDGGAVSVVWGIAGSPLPGEIKTSPYPMRPGILDRQDGVVEPASVGGAYLVTPVIDDRGVTAPLYSGSSGTGISGGGNPFTRYAFQSIGQPLFTSFEIPDALPNGDTSFLLKFDTFREIVPTGTLFDFTSFVAGGINEFTMSGINPGLAADETGAPPFIWGATYSQNGVAEVNIIAVPEPSGLILLSVGALSVGGLAIRRRLR
jgi:hypothetical protein